MGEGIYLFILFVLGILGLALLILPIVALVIAVKNRRRLRELQAQFELLRIELCDLRQHRVAADFEAAGPAPKTGAEETAKALFAAMKSTETEVPPLAVAAAPVAALTAAPAVESAVPAPPVPPTTPPPPSKSLEERIGLWLPRVGAVAVLAGLGYFFKFMVDNDWIGPWGRVLIGVAAGIGFLGVGELMSRREKTHPIFVQILVGIGLAALLMSTYASFAFYHLVEVLPAFVVVALLALFGGALAVHHRSESILVLSLLAVFANPVLLSTGVDRPLGLFTYLLLMSSAAMVVAVRLRFRVALWTAVAGVVVLFVGWYDRFFDPSPPPPPGTVDELPEKLQGPYFPLAARTWPLLFSALFPLQWLLAAFSLRSRGQQKTSAALVLTAALASHAAATALLYDRPLVLGLTLCLLGLGFAVVLTRERLSNWLGLPMVASFGILASLTGQIGESRLLPMMALTGGLSAVYFLAFFRRAWISGRLFGRWALLGMGGAGLGLCLLGLLWLHPEHFGLFGLLLTCLSAVYLLLASMARSVLTLLAAFLCTLGGMLVAGQECAGTDSTFLLVSGLWALIYLAAVCVDLFVRDAPVTLGRLFVLAGCGLGFGALVLTGTAPEANILRAVLGLAGGVIYLLVGLRMTRWGERGQFHALLPFGVALVFLTLAVFFLFTGVTITVLWAVEGAVLAYLACTTGRRPWLFGALALFAVAAAHLLAVDLHWLYDQYWHFRDTLGLEGLFAPTAFLHPRALALLALGASLLFSARLTVRRRSDAFFSWTALGLLVAGHAAVLGLLVGELRILFTSYPAVPAGPPAEEFLAMVDQAESGLAAQAARLDMVATVVLGAYAALLLGLGFFWRERWHRLLGIALFGITLAKLCGYDIWELERVFQIVVLVAVGLLLLVGGFLYARFGKRIREMLMDNGKHVVFLLALGAGLLASDARALSPESYEWVRPISGVASPGDYRLVLDVSSFGQSQAAFEDLRIAGPDGAEVPFLVRPIPVPAPPVQIPATVVDPVLLPDGGSQAVLDLGQSCPRHFQVELDVDGDNYLRSTRIESSRDGKSFGLLAEGAYLFQVSSGGTRAQRSRLCYPPSDARFLRITLLPGKDGQRLVIHGARAYRFEEPSTATGASEGMVALAMESPIEHEHGLTRITLGPLPPGAPLHMLRLQVAAAAFVRTVRVEGSVRKQAWFPSGGGVIYRVSGADATRSPQEELSLPIDPGARSFLRLVIDDGDNPPLEVRGVEGVYPLQEIVFRAGSTGDHTLYLGRAHDEGARYDLAALLARGGTAELRDATLGPAALNPRKQVPVATEPEKPWTEKHAWIIQGVIGAVVLLLAVWTFFLIRRARKGSPPGQDR